MKKTNFNFDGFYKRAGIDGVPLEAVQFRSKLAALQYAKVYQVTIDYLGPDAKVMDWGCGSGHFSYFLTYLNVQCSAYSFQECSQFLTKKNIEFIRGSELEPIELPYSNSEFDMVFSIGVLEHVYETGGDEVSSMKEIARILKPGGLFMCFHFPNKHGWIEPTFNFLRLTKKSHKRKYGLNEIKNYINVSGLELIEYGLYNFLPRNNLSKLPFCICSSKKFISFYEWIDKLLVKIMPAFCQNYYFIARK